MVLPSFWLHQLVTSDAHLSFFTAECDAAGKGVSTFKCEVTVLSQNKVARSVQQRGEQLYQVEENRIPLGDWHVLFAAVMLELHQCAVVKKELIIV